MNIFYLDEDLTLCAQAHCDKHVIKMLLESAQILCSVLHKTGQGAPYRATHMRHPCVIWAAKSMANWLWLKALAKELNQEYRFRFESSKDHKSFSVISGLLLPIIKDIGLTERPQAMPEIYQRLGDPLTAYRNYYKAEKSHLLEYRKRGLPQWLAGNEPVNNSV